MTARQRPPADRCGASGLQMSRKWRWKREITAGFANTNPLACKRTAERAWRAAAQPVELGTRTPLPSTKSQKKLRDSFVPLCCHDSGVIITYMTTGIAWSDLKVMARTLRRVLGRGTWRHLFLIVFVALRTNRILPGTSAAQYIKQVE